MALPVAGNRVSLKQVMNRATRIVPWFLLVSTHALRERTGGDPALPRPVGRGRSNYMRDQRPAAECCTSGGFTIPRQFRRHLSRRVYIPLVFSVSFFSDSTSALSIGSIRILRIRVGSARTTVRRWPLISTVSPVLAK